MTRDALDPKGLIAEAYRIDGIGPAECRSILLDWVLSLPEGQGPAAAIGVMLARHGDAAPDHPMTRTLRAGLDPAPVPRRRGGRSGRSGPDG